MGVTQATIGQYERGQRNPKLETLQRFAAALDVDIGVLLNKRSDAPVTSKDGKTDTQIGAAGHEAFIANYHALNTQGKYKVHDYTADLRNNPQYAPKEEQP